MLLDDGLVHRDVVRHAEEDVGDENYDSDDDDALKVVEATKLKRPSQARPQFASAFVYDTATTNINNGWEEDDVDLNFDDDHDE